MTDKPLKEKCRCGAGLVLRCLGGKQDKVCTSCWNSSNSCGCAVEVVESARRASDGEYVCPFCGGEQDSPGHDEDDNGIVLCSKQEVPDGR